MTPNEIKEQKAILDNEMKYLEDNKKATKESLNNIERKIEIVKFRASLMQSKCTHSYAEKKASGAHLSQLGLCTYCGASDY